MGNPLRFRDDQAPEEPAVSLDAFLDQSNASTVRIEAGDDVRLLLPYLDRVRLVEIDFPRFRDGRGFSSARILREVPEVSRVDIHVEEEGAAPSPAVGLPAELLDAIERRVAEVARHSVGDDRLHDVLIRRIPLAGGKGNQGHHGNHPTLPHGIASFLRR